MQIFSISEPDGTQWGTWAASSAQEAAQMLADSATHDPEGYPGYSSEAKFIVAEDPVEDSHRPTQH